jgi:recombination protein RecT
MTKSLSTSKEIRDLVAGAERRFNDIVDATGNRMVFKQEALYAMQLLLGNDYLAQMAIKNPISFKLAMAQIATTGLTLNPAMGLAYLVPRDDKVIADISYRGLIKIATDTRSVNLVVAEQVYSHDRFVYRGSSQEPVHDFDPFLNKADRGEFRGVYVKAYLAMGTLLITPVSAEDVYAARDISSAWVKGKPGKKGPWESHFGPMALKTGVKIARKFWPMTSPVLENVISYLNEEGGEGFAPGPVTLDVAARELGVEVKPGVGMDAPAPYQPVVMPQAGQLDQMEQMEEVAERVNAAPASVKSSPAQAPEPTVRTQPNKVAVPADPGEVDPKVVERIESVLKRCQRLKSWQAGLEWVATNLTGAAYDLAMDQFSKAQAKKVAA